MSASRSRMLANPKCPLRGPGRRSVSNPQPLSCTENRSRLSAATPAILMRVAAPCLTALATSSLTMQRIACAVESVSRDRATLNRIEMFASVLTPVSVFEMARVKSGSSTVSFLRSNRQFLSSVLLDSSIRSAVPRSSLADFGSSSMASCPAEIWQATPARVWDSES